MEWRIIDIDYDNENKDDRIIVKRVKTNLSDVINTHIDNFINNNFKKIKDFVKTVTGIYSGYPVEMYIKDKYGDVTRSVTINPVKVVGVLEYLNEDYGVIRVVNDNFKEIIKHSKLSVNIVYEEDNTNMIRFFLRG